MPLPHICHVITIEGSELPPGHSYAIVRQPDGEVVVFAADDDRAQLEARRAFLAWDRVRRVHEMTPAARSN